MKNLCGENAAAITTMKLSTIDAHESDLIGR